MLDFFVRTAPILFHCVAAIKSLIRLAFLNKKLALVILSLQNGLF